MRKRILALVLVMAFALCGCSEQKPMPIDTPQTKDQTEIEKVTPEEAQPSAPFSESEQSEAMESSTAPEIKQPEPQELESEMQKQPAQTALPEDTGVTALSQDVPETPPVSTSKPQEAPKQEPASSVPQPSVQKTAYDYAFDMEAIKADCIEIGLSMGLNLDSSLTPSNAASWNPVTASENSQGAALKRNLESYIKFHTVENLGAYGIDEITDFNIYYEARGNGAYSIYFLFA